MHLLYLSIASLASQALAMPGMAAKVKERQSLPSNLPLSSEEGNSGPIPSLLFNAVDQFVDVRPGTTHQFIAPTSTDERGPCPGLNAAANHGFLPRNGIATIQQSKWQKKCTLGHVLTFDSRDWSQPSVQFRR